MKKIIVLALLLASSIPGISQSKKILIVSTNVDSVGNNVSGTYVMEIAYPLQYFTDKGFAVDVVTPNGGKAAIYRAAKQDDDLTQIQASELFVNKTSNTLSPDQVNPKKYAAIYYPGGHGQYFDVLSDERIASIAAGIYEHGGVIGTAGHGAASLVNIRLKNSRFLVDGKTMTCFPLFAEKQWMNISNYGKLLPFDMEALLKRRGANLIISTPETVKDETLSQVVDKKNRMVTGSFARSAKWVAEQMVEMLVR